MNGWGELAAIFLVSGLATRYLSRYTQQSERWTGLLQARLSRLALFFLVALTLAAVISLWLTPSDPLAVDIGARLRSPSWSHPFGTDMAGRDVLSRLIFGARSSLTAAGIGVLVAGLLGVAVGLASGLLGGLWDRVLMRVVDAALAIPRLFLILMVVALWGTVRPTMLGVLLGATGWFVTSRLIRAEVLTLKEQTFLKAARASGATPWRIALRYTLPHVAATTIVSMALGFAGMILIEAGLGYLGIGVPSLDPSWGGMIREATAYTRTEPWLVVVPGATITLTVIAVNVLGDELRAMLNPRTSP